MSEADGSSSSSSSRRRRHSGSATVRPPVLAPVAVRSDGDMDTPPRPESTPVNERERAPQRRRIASPSPSDPAHPTSEDPAQTGDMDVIEPQPHNEEPEEQRP